MLSHQAMNVNALTENILIFFFLSNTWNYHLIYLNNIFYKHFSNRITILNTAVKENRLDVVKLLLSQPTIDVNMKSVLN